MKLALSHIVATLMVLCAVVLHVMADNPDAPNIDFSHGNYDNWTLYVGDYEASAPTSDVYNYTWTRISPASAYVTNAQRMMLINAVDQNDPIVSCSDFYTNPFAGSIVTRIGVPLTTEGMPSASGGCQNRWNLYRAAAAEKMTYTYTVTEGSSILRYDFAAVLNVPDNSNHSGEQLPYFGIKVEVNDAATGSSYVVPCGSYETNANESTSSLLHNKPIEECRSSRAGASAGNYVYRPWTNGTIDLRDYVGKSVTITIITHDCIVQCGNYNVAGGHESYAYFRANATSVGLQTSNCGIDDGIITAPAGYASYTWSRSDGLDATGIIYDPARPNQIKVPRSTIREGVVYKCVLSDEMGCAHIEITTKLDPVLLTPGFEYENHCGGEVKFTDNTTVSGDVVTRWQWDFGDGDYSFDTNPMHSYTAVGDYDVKLIVQTEKGCSATVTKKVRVRFFPSLAITASSPVCKGSEF
ncbi:MAG: PKD domain-containing protein, partial [Paludibacteraceae bacterium]|nr:PKD domain-containing protein [Paludibacteraceae bacterium]